VIRLLFFPTQPKPLFAAQALSKTGAESTKALPETSPISVWMKCNNSFNFSLIT
jgi:hypothetical protein